jgi:hypothetical protein
MKWRELYMIQIKFPACYLMVFGELVGVQACWRNLPGAEMRASPPVSGRFF